MKIEVTLPFTSRLKRTPLWTKKGKTFFGLWKKPNIKLDGDEKVIKISSDQIGQLDLLAQREYNDRSLFWAIAQVNNIGSISDEVVAGLNVFIPKLSNIRSALSDTAENG